MRNGKLYLITGSAQMPLLNAVMLTESMLERMRGLLWRKPLRAGEALLIDRCGSVHSCGMHYPLDLAFLDRRMRIRKCVSALRAWRFACCFSAVMTLEMPAGSIDRLNLKTGMQLLWQEHSNNRFY